MAKKELNLKAVFSADTKGIKQGAKESQQAVKEFGKQSEAALGDIGGMFGEVGTIMNTFKGGVLTLVNSFKSVTTATTGTASAMKVLKTALISSGIGAIVVALGSLVAYFTKSQRGADQLARIMAPLKQILNIVSDTLVKVGEAIMWAFTNPKEAINGFIELVKNQVINRVTGLIDGFKGLGRVIKGVFTLNWEEMKAGAEDYANAVKQTITGLTKDQREDLWDKGKKGLESYKDSMNASLQLERDRQALREREIASIVRFAKLEASVAQEREKAANKELSAQERLNAAMKARELWNTLINERISLEREQLRLLEAEHALSESSADDRRAEEEQKAKIFQLEKERADTQRRLNSLATTAAKEVEKERIERERIARLDARKSAELTLKPAVELDGLQELTESINEKAQASIKPLTMEVEIKPPANEDVEVISEALQRRMEATMQSINGAIQGALTEMAVALGEFIGKLIAGEGSIGNIGQEIIKVLANLMSNVGQILIAFGAAMIALKGALMNPYTAIAAGVGLVALAAALSAAVSAQISSATGGVSAGATTGTYMSAGGTLDLTKLQDARTTVEVSGSFKVQGTELIAAISNTNKKQNITT